MRCDLSISSVAVSITSYPSLTGVQEVSYLLIYLFAEDLCANPREDDRHQGRENTDDVMLICKSNRYDETLVPYWLFKDSYGPTEESMATLRLGRE